MINYKELEDIGHKTGFTTLYPLTVRPLNFYLKSVRCVRLIPVTCMRKTGAVRPDAEV